jgi:hypothetical protein
MPSSGMLLILVTLIMEALSSSETSVLTRATLRNIPEDGILNVQIVSYRGLIEWTAPRKQSLYYLSLSTYSY